VHLNSCLMIGRVSAKGPQLRYAESGSPFCSFVLEIDELTDGKVYTTYIPCEITGKYAEQTSVEVEAGDEIQISGKWKYKSTVDQKSDVKVSKPVVSSWGVSQRIPALAGVAATERDASPKSGHGSEGSALHLGHSEAPETKKRRKPRYPLVDVR
jgi:single-stranded DNA-binding protein